MCISFLVRFPQVMPNPEKRFADYKAEGHVWITLSTGEYYPDILALACELYKPVLTMFGQILAEAHSSTNLFLSIATVKESWMFVQLARVFRKYVSPETPVEMLRRRSAARLICDRFGKRLKLASLGAEWNHLLESTGSFPLRRLMKWMPGEKSIGPPTGNPRRKVYLDESAGIGVQDIWLDFRDAHNQNILITGYPTEKNSALLTRIIAASSGPGDLVLDCFSGSGTTLAVADSLKRRWIGIDKSEEAIRTTLKRFEHGLEPMGDFVSERENAKAIDNGQNSLFSGISDVPENSSYVKKTANSELHLFCWQ